MGDWTRWDGHSQIRRLRRRSLLAGAAATLGGLASAAFFGQGSAQTPSPSPTPGGAGPPPATPTPNPAYLASPPVDQLQRQILATSPFLFQAPVDNLDGLITPNRVHFVRNHYNTPQLDAKTWKLEVQGAVSKPLTLNLAQLQAMPSRTVVAFIECSGNGRAFFQPKTTGAPWTNGGVSVAEWTGVQLSHLLDLAGIVSNAVDILSEGSDSGRVFRAIPKVKAMDPDTILAYAQNGEALTYDNGYPVRLLSPGWGGINSIKWIAKITVFDHVFEGFYNDRYYVCETPGLPKTPVQALGVKSFITKPVSGASVPAGQAVTISG
jgi:DMSO/TMAO reductase YedYZ molybdopterin-dependent catalytic subunit